MRNQCSVQRAVHRFLHRLLEEHFDYLLELLLVGLLQRQVHQFLLQSVVLFWGDAAEHGHNLLMDFLDLAQTKCGGFL